MTADRFRAFAHRGGGLEAPENSLLAFQRATDLGFVELETDVRATSDGVAVIHHDATLDRTTDQRGRISDLTWVEVAQARIHGTEPVLRLDELLDELPQARFTLDAKDSAAVAAMLSVLATRADRDRITVGSFSHRRLRRIRSALDVTTSSTPPEVLALARAARANRPVRLPGSYVQIPTHVGRWRLLTPRLIDSAHRSGLEVHVWTIDDPGQMEDLIDLGVDGLMTDRPSVLASILQRRGLW